MVAVSAVWMALTVPILLLLCLILALLFVPVTFGGSFTGDLRFDDELEYGVEGAASWQARLAWGGWLVRLSLQGEQAAIRRWRLSICGIPLRRRKRTRSLKQSPRKKRRRRRFRLANLREIWDPVKHLALRLWRCLHLRASGHLIYGFSDPALTGITIGLLAATGLPRGFSVKPDFAGSRMGGDARIHGHTFGIQVLWAALRFGFSPAIRRRWLRRLSPRNWFRTRQTEGGRA